MRQLILILLSLINIIFVIFSLIFHIGIDFLSLRIIFVAFSFVLGLYFILLHQTRQQLKLAVFTVGVTTIHILLILHAVYTTIYV
ncbi:hypothetical protein [Staphylococcus lutrae]|uniref:Uncharacterized protein n=1 Tax=Staphylococcus lutrae TaxID=155085 RepID=A0AAC9WM60_9STAP|nr:hypothetical protein [Staphylococcus lutrae]ARJ50417.1 hypothetical protein B5P37_03380 [Staphylococcus lutrae]PNZ38763.1 hypothetical protein CD134_03560 [Staphylococcus lutrae]